MGRVETGEGGDGVCPFIDECPHPWWDSFPIGTNGDKKMKDYDCEMREAINSGVYNKKTTSAFIREMKAEIIARARGNLK